jgi:hypothetical protein
MRSISVFALLWIAGQAAADPSLIVSRKAGPSEKLQGDEYADCTYTLATSSAASGSQVVARVLWAPGDTVLGTATWGGGKYTMLTCAVFKNSGSGGSHTTIAGLPFTDTVRAPTASGAGWVKAEDGEATITFVTPGVKLLLSPQAPNNECKTGGVVFSFGTGELHVLSKQRLCVMASGDNAVDVVISGERR